MFFPEPDRTFSWVGEAKAFNTTTEGPPRRDLKNDMGFVVSKRYPLDEGQSSHMNVRRLVEPGPGYEVVFDKPKTRDQVKDTFFEKGVRDDTLAHSSKGGFEPAQGLQVRLIPVGKEPTATWQVQILDSQTPLKMPAARALQDSISYAKEAIAPGMPDGIKAHIQNHTVPPDAKRFQVLSFDKPKTRDQVEEILSKNGVRADQVQLIPTNQLAPLLPRTCRMR
jgi:hypothetical protein